VTVFFNGSFTVTHAAGSGTKRCAAGVAIRILPGHCRHPVSFVIRNFEPYYETDAKQNGQSLSRKKWPYGQSFVMAPATIVDQRDGWAGHIDGTVQGV
jgi:hypothetical protein